mmetsp:Transcript_35402/g.101077  ORF Transcript_35402/g.101077 Transcript_35402/m.101077 type:complete len:242 (-) Transcript_35402:335-1060(-)
MERTRRQVARCRQCCCRRPQHGCCSACLHLSASSPPRRCVPMCTGRHARIVPAARTCRPCAWCRRSPSRQSSRAPLPAREAPAPKGAPWPRPRVPEQACRFPPPRGPMCRSCRSCSAPPARTCRWFSWQRQRRTRVPPPGVRARSMLEVGLGPPPPGRPRLPRVPPPSVHTPSMLEVGLSPPLLGGIRLPRVPPPCVHTRSMLEVGMGPPLPGRIRRPRLPPQNVCTRSMLEVGLGRPLPQ